MLAAKTKAQELQESLGRPWERRDEFTLHRVLRDAELALRRGGVDATGLHVAAASAALKLGDVEGAIAHWRSALQFSPDAAELWGNLGVALMNARRNDEALEALLRASDALGDAVWTDIALLANLAEALWLVGRRADAVFVLRRAESAADQANPDHLFRLSDASAAMGEHLAAVWLVARALSPSETPPTGPDGCLPSLGWLRGRSDAVVLSAAQSASVSFAEKFVIAATAECPSAGDTDPGRSEAFEATLWLRRRALESAGQR